MIVEHSGNEDVIFLTSPPVHAGITSSAKCTVCFCDECACGGKDFSH